jgi:hypothetical protein
LPVPIKATRRGMEKMIVRSWKWEVPSEVLKC